MGHSICACLFRSEYDPEASKRYDLEVIGLPQEVKMIPLVDNHLDHWSEKLAITGAKAVQGRPIYNMNIVHHMATKLLGSERFAVIDTDYFGGNGDQSAAVYENGRVIMSPEVDQFGPINKALGLLGVKTKFQHDRFETVDLHRYRNFDDAYAKYQHG